MYNSINHDQNARLFQEKVADKDYLAVRTKNAIAPYIDHEHWGINRLHRITKDEHVARHKWLGQKNQGIAKPKVPIADQHGNPWLNDKGQPVYFNYHLNYRAKLWLPANPEQQTFWLKNIQRCIDGDETHYGMSPKRPGRKFGYGDLDCHEEWQDDLPQAIELASKWLGKIGFSRHSHRGYNFWIKFRNAPWADEYNAGLAKFEQVFSDLFAEHKIKTSFEVKGRSHHGKIASHDDRRTHLAKLPYWNHKYPCLMRNEDDCWNIRRVDEFDSKPEVEWREFVGLIEHIESQLDPDKVADGRRYIAHVAGKSNATKSPAVSKVAMESTGAPAKPVMPSPRATDMCVGPTEAEITFNHHDLSEIRSVEDAFTRQHRFAMWLSRRMRRVVTVDELLEAVHEHEMFRGKWNDGLSHRRRRCQDILSFVARSFDPELCGQKSQRPVLDVNIAKWKAKAWRLPVTADRHVESVLAAIIETASKANGDCPRASIQGWWEELAAEGIMPKWTKERYYAARSILLKRKVIKIDHDRYQYVPDAKGRCKGIWIRPERNGAGAVRYCYPPSRYSLPLHNGYVANGMGFSVPMASWESIRPPP